MPQSAQQALITSVDLMNQETNASTTFGSIATTTDGRRFRYAKAGGSNLVGGNLIQAPAQLTNFKDMAVQAAAAVGATTISVTLGGSSTTANQFNQGYLVVTANTGIGQMFQIASHDVATNGTTCKFNLVPGDSVITALDTTSTVSVIKHPYDSVIQMPTAHTGAAVGGCIYPITSAKFGWLQATGAGMALSDATVTAAATMALSASVTTAGCVTKAVAQDFNVGVSLYTLSVSAEVQPILWTID